MPPRNHETGHHAHTYQRHVEELLQNITSKVTSGFRHAPGTSIAITALFSVFGTSGYVLYRDWNRERRMMNMFAKGNLLDPMTHDKNEVRLYPRHADMDKVRHLLRSEVSNQYYLVFGEVGTGKTRLITEVVRSMGKDTGSRNEGAPIYILASQGHSFPESFANAVDFHFDEHISLKFLMDYIFRVGQLPERDPLSQLRRLLNAIEKAAFRYLEDSGKPAVLVIDGVDFINDMMPDAIKLLQEKAKLWADTHIVKLVFVSNDEKTEEVMQQNHSAWSRAALPIVIGDLSPEEARDFLRLHDPIMTQATLECRKRRCKGHHHGDASASDSENPGALNGKAKGSLEEEEDIKEVTRNMPDDYVNMVIDLVGGRIQNLLVAKREWLKGSPFEYTATHLKLKERSKFIEITKTANQRRVIELLYAMPDRHMRLSEIIDQTSRDDVFACAFNNVIQIQRDDKDGLMVHFESRLTEVVVEEMYGVKTKAAAKVPSIVDMASSLVNSNLPKS